MKLVTDFALKQRLFSGLGRLLQQHLAAKIDRALEDLDAKFFALATAARVASEEQRLLDALRELRRQRTFVVRGFLARVGQIGAAPILEKRRVPASPLSLYARDELEERLALAAVAKSVSVPIHHVLYPLNCRLAALIGGPALDDESNPLGPLALAEGFRDALQALDIASDLRLLAYRTLPLSLLAGIEACYTECNEMLIGAGVLPSLPDEVARAETPIPISAAPVAVVLRDEPDASKRTSAARGSDVEALSPDSSESVESLRAPVRYSSGDMAGLLHLMLARRSGSAVPPKASLRGMADSREVTRERLLDAIAFLLRDASAGKGELKRLLLDLTQRQSPARVALSTLDEGTVDLVEAVFKRMSLDDVLPPSMSRALAGLRVPFLNAALRDQRLIADPSHPARLLIDEFAETARGWSATADPGQQLLRQMQAVQALLQARGEDHAAGFQQALSEFREFVATQRMQAEQAELRAIESTRSREALQQAQVDARSIVDLHMVGFTPSAWLRKLLSQHWVAYLVLVMLRYGVVSDHYRQALAFADALLLGERDSVNPIHAASFRARRLELETQLRQGLATLAYADDDIVRLCGELHTFILVGAVRVQSATVPAPEADELAKSIVDQPRPESHDPSVMRHLRGLRPGTWFELGEQDDDAERGRLSWISPMSGRWVLVNWAGRKLVDVPPERMATDIARGLARVIGDANLLRRAVDEVMAELQPEFPSDENSGGHAKG